jgi:hypothetical protein
MKLNGTKHIIANRIVACYFSQGKFLQGLAENSIEIFVCVDSLIAPNF